MSDEADEAVASHRYRWSAVSTAAASLLVTTTGVAVLIGWWVESQALIQVVELPGSRPMMPLTAVGFVLAGVALGLLRTTAAAASRLARIGTAMAAILVALSILVVVEHLAGSDLGIDRLLFPDAVQRHVRQDPGRPALLTALAFLAAGASLLLLDAPRTWQLVIAQLLALVAGFLGIQGLAGYGYMASASPPAHSELVGLVRMAIHTAATFVVLAIGILFSRPRRGVVRIVTGSDPGAILARRLLPAAILVPLVLGWLRVAGEQADLYGPATGSALFAAANMLVFTGLIGWNAALVRRLDRVREQAVKALRASEANYRTLVETAYEGIWVIDRTGRTDFVNPRMAEMLGYPADELARRPFPDFFPPDERAAAESVLAERSAHVRELRMRRRDGGELWILMSTSPVRDERGGQVGILAMATDVTERRRATEALRVSESRFRSVFESAGIGIAVVDSRGCYLMTNPVIEELFGYASNELLKKRFTDFTHPEDVRADEELFQQLIAGERESYQLEKRFVRKDGKVGWARVTGTLLAGPKGAPPKVIRTVEDISARKQLEHDRERLAAILATTPDFVATSDVQGRVQSINRAGRRMVGISDTDDVNRYQISDFHPPWALAVILGEGIPAAIRSGAWSGETAMLTREGTEIPVSQVILAHPSPPEKVEFLSTVVRDLSERVRREREERFLLEASRALTASLDEEEILGSVAKLLVDQQADFCLVDRSDADDRVRPPIAIHRDPAAQPLLDELASLGAAPGRGVGAAAAFQPGRTELVAEVTEAWLAAATGSEASRELLRRLGVRSHVVVPIQVHGRVLGVIALARTRPGTPFRSRDLWLFEDLAVRAAVAVENCRLYVQSREATHTRDEVLRVVAHDLRNPLSTIRLAAGAVRDSLPESMPQQHRQLEMVERSVQLSSRLIDDLLDVARMESGNLVVEPTEVDVADLVREAVELQRPMAEEKSITLEADVADALPAIWADRGRILQVFANLAGNAAKFTPEGGRITVRAQAEGEVVRFSVVDTGPGISDEDKPHLFDPFWQARPGSMGAGLGLPVARGIVQAHGGTLDVESMVGVGSTFSFTVPQARRRQLKIAG